MGYTRLPLTPALSFVCVYRGWRGRPARPARRPAGRAGSDVGFKKTVPFPSIPLPVPSGGSPDGTGGSPVLPTVNTYDAWPTFARQGIHFISQRRRVYLWLVQPWKLRRPHGHGSRLLLAAWPVL